MSEKSRLGDTGRERGMKTPMSQAPVSPKQAGFLGFKGNHPRLGPSRPTWDLYSLQFFLGYCKSCDRPSLDISVISSL